MQLSIGTNFWNTLYSLLITTVYMYLFFRLLILCSQKNHEYINFYKNAEEKAKGDDFGGELQNERNNISRNTWQVTLLTRLLLSNWFTHLSECVWYKTIALARLSLLVFPLASLPWAHACKMVACVTTEKQSVFCVFKYAWAVKQRSGPKLKTERETGVWGSRISCVWDSYKATLNWFWEKRPTVLQSTVWQSSGVCLAFSHDCNPEGLLAVQ